MNNLQNSLLDAMQTISKSAINNQANPITIEAEVVDVIDSALGLYKVRYLENYFNVYSNNISNNYKPGDTVYIIVPSNDFTKDKFIIGIADASLQTYVPSTVETIYDEISQDLLKNNELIELCSYKTNQSRSISFPNEFVNELYTYLKDFNIIGISCYIRTNLNFEQKGLGNYGLKLSLPIIRTNASGVTEETFKEILLDKSNIIGNPYELLIDSYQYLYGEFENNEVYDTSRQPELIVFVSDDGFIKDDEGEHDFDIFINKIQIKVYNKLDYSSLSGYYLSLKADTGRFFLVDQDKKIITPVLRLNGQETSFIDKYDCYWFEEDPLIKQTSEDYSSVGGVGWRCLNTKSEFNYLNQYTLEVNKTDLLYSKKYKCVLILKDSFNNAIQRSAIIELVDLSKDIDIYFTTENNSATVQRNGTCIITCNVDDKNRIFESNNIQFEWLVNEDPYVVTQKNIEDTITSQTLNFSTNNYTSSNLNIKCYVKYVTLEDHRGEPGYDDSSSSIKKVQKLLGTKSIVLTFVNMGQYYVSFKNPIITYKYDAAGNSPMVAEYDSPLGAPIKSITPISFELRDDKGNLVPGEKFTSRWIVPQDSQTMLDFTGHLYPETLGYTELDYGIKKQYDPNKTYNNVILRIKIGDSELDTLLNFTFLKDGESGTNGSSYSALIKYLSNNEYYRLNQIDIEGRRRNAKLMYIGVDDYDDPDLDIGEEDVRQKWYFYTYGTGSSKNYYNSLKDLDGHQLEFAIALYKDGVLIEDSSLYSVNWSIVNDPLEEDPSKGQYKKFKTNFYIRNSNQHGIVFAGNRWDSKDQVFYNMIKAEITINSSEDLLSQQIICAYYPLEITRISGTVGSGIQKQINGIEYTGTVPSLKGGFYEVLYSIDGKEPSYDSTTPFTCVDSLNDISYKNYSYKWSANDNFDLFVTEPDPEDPTANKSGVVELRPKTAQRDAIEQNYLKVVLDWDGNPEAQAEFERKLAEQQEAEKLLKAYAKFYAPVTIPSPIDNNKYRDRLMMLSYVYDKEELLDYFEKAKKVIDPRQSGIEIVLKMILKLELWYQYTKLEENKEKYYNDCIKKFDKALKALYKLGSEGQASFYGLDNLENLDDPASFVTELTKIDEDLAKKSKLTPDQLNALTLEEKDALNTKFSKLREDYRKKSYSVLVKKKNNVYVLLTEAENFYNYEDSYLAILNEVIKVRNPIIWSEDIKIEDPNWSTIYDDINSYYDSLYSENISYNSIKTNTYDTLILLLDPYFKKVDDTLVISDEENARCDSLYATRAAAAQKEEINLDSIVMEKESSQASIVHIRPILLRTNAYGLSAINGYDGQRITFDENNQQYIYAPQLGAGIKNPNGTYTGMVMGTIYNPTDTVKERVGLIGLNQGQLTFELSARDGSAKFGMPGKGRIEILPYAEGGSAIIEGGDYKEKDPGVSEGSGLKINLTEPYIKYGNGNFSVDKDGHLHAVDGEFEGKISASIGEIGGWLVTQSTLETKTNNLSEKLVLSSSLEGTYVDETYGSHICINPTAASDEQDFVAIQRLLEIDRNVQIKDLNGNRTGSKVRIYLDDSVEVDSQTYNNIYFTESSYEAKKYSRNIDLDLWEEDSEGDLIGLAGDDFVDLDGTPLFVFETYDYDEQDDIYIKNMEGEGNFLKVIKVPDPNTDYGFGLYPSSDLEDGTYPSSDSEDGTYPSTGNYSGEIPVINFWFSLLYKIYEESSNDFPFDTNVPVYCQLAENSFTPYYQIEKGYVKGGVWYKDFTLGDSIKYIMNKESKISLIYDIVNNEYIPNPQGSYIYIENRYGTGENVYCKMCNFVQFKDVPVTNSRKPDYGFVIFDNKTTRGKQNKHEYKNDKLVYKFPEIYQYQQGMVINNVWYYNRYGTFKIWCVNEGSESGGEPYTQEDFVYRVLKGTNIGKGIYFGEHTNLYSSNDGFYIGEQGLSVGQCAAFSGDSNEFFITATNNGRYKTSEVYVGSQGISAGYDNFYVGADGKLVAKGVNIEGKITSTEGSIGGFKIKTSNLEGTKLKLDPNGRIDFGSYGTIERIKGGQKESVVWYDDMVDYIAQYGAKVKVRVVSQIPGYMEEDTIYLVKGMYVPYYTYVNQ